MPTSQGLIAEGAGRFREVFARAGYNEAGLVETLGPVQLPRRLGRDRAYFRHRTRRGRPLDGLMRLFLLGLPEDLEAATRALAPIPAEEWARAGLIAIEGNQVRGLVRMMAFRNLVLASDHQETPEAQTRPDQVMGMTASTAALADFTVRRPARTALDLGTGTGVQAFLAAAHSDRVWATDSSARAIDFARFNAAFNGCGEKIEFLEGDTFEPVRGRTFDLVVSNPPFALTPSRRFAYRDSGVPLDGFARALIRNGAACLNEGGFCQIVCDWAHIADQDWKERLAEWFDGTGCDAWVMRTDTHDVAGYAHVWIRDTEEAGEEESARLYDEWLAYYAGLGLEAVSTGLIAIRKASGRRNWVRIEDGPAGNSGAFGEYVLGRFALRDFLEGAPDNAALLGAKFRVAQSVRLDHVCEWGDASWRIRSAKIRMAQGLPYESDIDLRLAGMVALCDGQRTIGEILEKAAKALGEDLERFTPNCLALMRELIERGFLLPAK